MNSSDAAIFDVSDYHGIFCTGGKCSLPAAPGIRFESVPIPLPVTSSFADWLKEKMHSQKVQKPPMSSRCFEVDGAAVVITNPRFGQSLKELVGEILETLGIDQKNAGVELVKMYIETSTSDQQYVSAETDMPPNQFGFLEIQFPSDFTGGSHAIRDNGFQSNFILGADDGSCSHQCYFMAWYVGCEHDRQPVASGCRLIATYSLLWKGDTAPPRAPSMSAVDRVAKGLAGSDKRFAFFLQREGLDHGLQRLASFQDLQGSDRRLYGLLKAASERMEHNTPGDGLELLICTVATVEEYNTVADAEVDLSRPVFRPDGAPPRPAALEMLQRLVIPGELDLRGWDPDEPQEEVDGWRNEQGISTRWGCFACSDSRYMHNKRRFHDSEMWEYTAQLLTVWRRLAEPTAGITRADSKPKCAR